MYFDFEDYRPDITPVGQAISWREGLLLSIIGHMALIIFLLLSPRLFPHDPAAEARARLAVIQPERPPEERRFVFVDPKVDLESLRAPDLAPLSDKNRVARTPAIVPKPTNPLPNSPGNTPERVERVEPEVARGRGTGPDPSLEPPVETAVAPAPVESASPPKPPESTSAVLLPSNKPAASPRVMPGGALSDALRNIEKYIKPEQFENTQGGAQFGNIQFDTKGVEFGPWVRRFAAQVRRNWDPLIPTGPMMLRQRGHVVITLNVHKNGSITDVSVATPSAIEGYNTAAFGALTFSNPTQPLPPEYPADKAFFTITFFYNERPPDR
jgi:TonB family protein